MLLTPYLETYFIHIIDFPPHHGIDMMKMVSWSNREQEGSVVWLHNPQHQERIQSNDNHYNISLKNSERCQNKPHFKQNYTCTVGDPIDKSPTIKRRVLERPGISTQSLT